MIKRSASMLVVAGGAATVQALVTLGAFAWLSRTLPVAEVGRFGLYLAVVAFALALDGVRQTVVVAAASGADDAGSRVAHLAFVSLNFGVVVAAAIALFGQFVLGLSWAETVPLAATCFVILASSPGIARLEASGGPHLAVALHSISWSIALALGAVIAVHDGHAHRAAWAMLAGPVVVLAALASRGLLVIPAMRRDRDSTRMASQGIGSHLATAAAGFLDKAVIATLAGPAALGLYSPLSELTGRASALAGLVSNLFLNDETRFATRHERERQVVAGHSSLMNAYFLVACFGIVAAAVLARPILEAFVARSTATEVLTIRILLACLALNIGAQWSAVTLRARGQFDLYRPYVLSLLAGLALAPWLVSRAGIVGGAVVVLVLRLADVALIVRAGRMLTPTQGVSVAATATIVLAVAVAGAILSTTGL